MPTDTIRRDSRQIPALKERLTVCLRFDQANDFHGKPCDPKHAWDKLAGAGRSGRRVRLTFDGDAVYTISVHDNLWYELREPAAFAHKVGLCPCGLSHDTDTVIELNRGLAAGGGCTGLTADPDGPELPGAGALAPPEPTEASIHAVLREVGAAGPGIGPGTGLLVHRAVAAALMRGWTRGHDDTLTELESQDELDPALYGQLCALFEAAWHHAVPATLDDLPPATSAEARKLAMLAAEVINS